MQVNWMIILHCNIPGWELEFIQRHYFSVGSMPGQHTCMEVLAPMMADYFLQTTGAIFLFIATLMSSRLYSCTNSRTGSVDFQKEILLHRTFSPAAHGLCSIPKRF